MKLRDLLQLFRSQRPTESLYGQFVYQFELVKWALRKKNCVPTDEADILGVELENNFSFPLSYREFLQIAGEWFDPFSVMGFSDWLIKNDVNESAVECLEECNLHLDRRYWVFAEDGGALYLFFLDEGENPPVYIVEPEYYHENPDHYFRQISHSFSEFIKSRISR